MNTKTLNKERILYPDFLRAISCISIVIIHVTSVATNDYSIDSNIYLFSSIINGLMRWAVPIFFMISGMFLLDPEHELPFYKLKKKILQLLLCILIWGIFYSLLDDYVNGILGGASIVRAALYVIKGVGGYHLWFLYTLLLIYLMLPVFRLITKHASKKMLEGIIVAWFMFSICVGWLNDLSNEIEIFSLLKINYSLEVITGYAGYFLMGYFLSHYANLKKRYSGLMIAAMGSVICFAYIATVKVFNVEPDVLGEANGVLSCLLSIAIFMLFKQIKIDNNVVRNTIGVLSQNSFGIYLTHVFWITLIFRILNVDYTMFGYGVSLVFWIFIIVALSLITTAIMRRIPYIKKIVTI